MSDTPDLAALGEEARAAIGAATSTAELDDVRVRFTGRRSPLADAQRGMAGLDADGKRALGMAINAFKRDFESAWSSRRADLESAELDARLRSEARDLTMPARRRRPGRPHLLTQVERDIVDFFVGMGYAIAEGPEVEAATYAFDLLNIPPGHPARQEMDTIYVDDDHEVVLRPHTSPAQARVMLRQPPPIAVVVPGRVYRQDTVDATHSPVFTQVEGLVVAEDITLAHLRGTLLAFARAMFGDDRDIRLRPSMFPFTEPSLEVDVSSDGHGSHDGWIEVLGSGMVDPAVLDACGLDSERHGGFAFGIGVERVAMLRHRVADIRHFYDADARFLAAF